MSKMNRNVLKQLGRLAGFIALPLLLVDLIALLVFHLEWYVLVGLILVLVLGAIFAATNPEVWQRSLGRQRTSSTISAIVVSIAFLGIVVLINVLLQRVTIQWDLTQNQSFTISDASVKVVQSLKAPTTAIVFYDPTTATQEQTASDLLHQFAAKGDKLSVQTIDASSDPLSVQKYKVSANPSVVFVQGARQELVTTFDEQTFDRTLLKVQSDPKRVLIVSGHKEASVVASQTATSVSTAVQSLANNNYIVLTYNSATGTGTPFTASADATGATPAAVQITLDPANDILLIFGPGSKFSDVEKTNLTNFLKEGGKAFITYDIANNQDPASATNVNDLLSSWGVSFQPGIALESDPSHHLPQSAALIQPSLDTTSDVDTGLSDQNPVIVANATALVRQDGFQGTINNLLTTSSSSYLKTNLQSQTAEFEQGDVRGPLILGLSIQQAATMSAPTISGTNTISGTTNVTGTASTAALETRIVAVGTTAAFSDQILPQVSPNDTFLLNAMNFLGASGTNITIPSKADATKPFTVTQAKAGVTFWASFLGLPVLVLFLGLVIWWRRR